MKKNISINISGIIFHIEEDGYDTLRKYLDSVNKYFATFDDNSEILSDIEGRIAEIFLSKLNDGKQVITSEDVSSLMATMGSVNDFKAAEEQEFAAGEPAKEKRQEKTTTTPPKKLMRDGNRKILGGVCAGLGHYFNIDPVWPRLLLALLTVGTSGAFLLAYIVMWIVLPVADLEEETTIKKMYRDPDKKVVGGVGAGVAAFFGTDIALMRFIFVILAFFGGIGIVIYIVLWIVLPEAKTITEKMKMQGEPVTLSNIESTVKKGLNEKDAPEESVLTKIILLPFRAIGALLTALGPIFRVLLDIVRVAIGLLLTLIGLALIISVLFLFGVVVGLVHTPDWAMFSDWHSVAPDFPLTAFKNSFPGWIVFVSFLTSFIPALFLILLGTSIIAKRIVFNAMVGWGLFVAFFVSLMIVGLSLPQIIYGFKEEGEFKTEQVFALNGKTPVLQLNEAGLDGYKVVSLSLKGYDGKDIKVLERFQAQGATRKIGAENAQAVTYGIVQADSIITFDSNIAFKPDAKFRAQRLDVEILIPYNQAFVVDVDLWRILNTDIIDHSKNYDYSLNQETRTWKITENGMECLSCPVKPVEASTLTNSMGLKDFNSIDLKGLFNVEIIHGEQFGVEIDGDARKRYDIYVNGETLVIDYEDHGKSFWKRNWTKKEELKMTITMPSLRELDVTGAGKLEFTGFTEEEVDIKLSGAVDATGELHADNLDVQLTGASSLDLTGGGGLLEADIVGASGLRAYGYEVKHCIVEAHGVSTAKVNATETLETKNGVTSSISHRGNPEVIKR